MKIHKKYLLAVVLISMGMICTGVAFGAISAEEASQLGGPVLTPLGAERAGNKEGTIPAWTEGMIPIPKSYKPGSGIYPDPYADEKPLFSINAKNMAQYADKLSEGHKTLMRRYPDYRMDIYKTHRMVSTPQWWYDNTKKIATICGLTNDGETLTGKGCHAGLPFPIPKTGIEMYWNANLGYTPGGYTTGYEAYNITPGGRASLSAKQLFIADLNWSNPDKPDDWRMYTVKMISTGPPRRVGEIQIYQYPLDYRHKGYMVWLYLPGQRRVRVAPDVCCDTPNVSTAGASVYDDSSGFNGNPDRFTWKLLGKKEMYIQANTYKLNFWQGPVDQVLKPHFINPDFQRYELMRVWVVELTLKPGKRHVYGRRLIYAPEDSYSFQLVDNFDLKGNLYRMTVKHSAQVYGIPGGGFTGVTEFYDLIANSYAVHQWPRGGFKVNIGWHPDEFFSPDNIAGEGIR